MKGGFGRVLRGLACGLVAGPLLILAALIARSGNLTYEYEAVLLADSMAASDAIEVRIDGAAQVRRQHIDLPTARLPRLVLFEPHGRQAEGAVLEIVRREAGGGAILVRKPLDRPQGDIRCIVVVTIDAGAVEAGACCSLMRYL